MSKLTKKPPTLSRFSLITLIDNRGRLFGKYDLFLPLFIIICVVLAYFIGKVLLQKDTYITAELFASGGEWWWDNPAPPYWLTDPVKPGDKEYDPQGNVLVEVIDTKKFEAGDRKMLWMKVKLKVTPQDQAKQYRFRREPIQIGSLVYVAPNNVRIFTNVMSLEGIEDKRTETYKTLTLKEYDMFPWHANSINIGDQMKTDDGKVLAEVLEKQVVPAEIITTDDRGNVFTRTNPLRRDVTLKVRAVLTESQGVSYFSYFQPVKVGFYLWFPFEKTNISGNVIKVE